MARPKGRPKKAGGEGVPVRIDPAIATQARYLAALTGQPMSDYISELLRPVIEREMRAAGRKLMGGEK